ncbi:MAG: ABC transporter substrate-binding protein [Candidatus Woesearchaeota archaeon]|nr:ABC transporter substrate-binding protein [Candidatus Woesearchaeota archaeon]
MNTINAKIALIILLLGTACTVPDDRIVIGGVLPLTGDFALYGNDEVKAVALFMHEHEGYRFVPEDTESAPRKAVTATRKLLRADNPDVILTTASPSALAIQPITNEHKVPVFVAGVNPDVANGFMLQNLPTSEQYIERVVADMQEKGVQRVGMIYRNDGLGLPAFTAMKKHFKGELFAEASSVEERDYRSIITKVASNNPEVFFVVSGGKSLGSLIKQIRTLHGDIPIYSTIEVNYEDAAEGAGDAYHTIIYSDVGVDYEQSRLEAFRDAYLAMHNSEPSLDSIVAYNAMLFIHQCRAYVDTEDFFTCIQTAEIEGLTGKLRIDNNLVDYTKVLEIKKI